MGLTSPFDTAPGRFPATPDRPVASLDATGGMATIEPRPGPPGPPAVPTCEDREHDPIDARTDRPDEAVRPPGRRDRRRSPARDRGGARRGGRRSGVRPEEDHRHPGGL